jgi:hypothetical protein
MRLPTLLLLVLTSTALSAPSADAQWRRRVIYADPYYYGYTWTYPTSYYSYPVTNYYPTQTYSYSYPATNGTVTTATQAVVGPSATVSTSNYTPSTSTNGQASGTVTTSQPVVTYPTTTYYYAYPTTTYYWPSGYYYPTYYDYGWRVAPVRTALSRWYWW